MVPDLEYVETSLKNICVKQDDCRSFEDRRGEKHLFLNLQSEF